MASNLLQESATDKLLQEDGTSSIILDTPSGYYGIQHKKVQGGGATTTVGSYDNLPGVGNLLVIGITSGGVAGSPICTGLTDNQSNSWSQAGTFQKLSGEEYVQIFYCVPTTSSGTFTITATFTGTSQSNTLGIHEYAGNLTPTASVLDQTTKATGTSVSPATGTLTPASNGSLIFVVEADDVTTDGAAITAGTDFTMRISELFISTKERYGDEDYVQPTAASHDGTFSITENVNWGAKIAVFKPPAVVASPLRPLTLLGVG